MDTLSGFSFENISLDRMQLMLYALGGAGLLYCFAGYRLFRLVLALTGFLIAGLVAGALSGWFSAGDALVMLVCGVFGGVCGALALTFVYKLGVFGLGCMAAVLVSQQVSMELIDAPQWFVVLGAGLLGGLIALALERPAMTLATAAIGAWMATLAAYIYLSGLDLGKLEEAGESVGASPQSALWMFAAWFALAAIGASVQFRLARKPEKTGN